MDIVRKPYQRHVLRNTQSTVFDSRKGRKGDDVVECQDSIWTVVAIQQLFCITQSRLVVYLVTHHQITVYRNLVVAQRFQIAVLAPHHHIKMVRTTNKRYLPTARLYQVLRGHICRLVTIGRHAREALRQTRTTEEHQGDAHLGNLLKMVVVPRCLRQTGNDALHM